ncbi:MAG: hypothetical protein IJZ53_06930 [Tyzzerella sp.]|nr:hypothetical protein [Tyzzerella sp.]
MVTTNISWVQIHGERFKQYLQNMEYQELALQYQTFRKLKESLGDYDCAFFFAEFLEWFEDALCDEIVSRYATLFSNK